MATNQASRLGQGTRARLPIMGQVMVDARVRFYGGRVGTISEYNADEVGVRFTPSSGAVWFRPADLIRLTETTALPADRRHDRAGRHGRPE